jgi:hypothetical protein
VLDTGPVPLSKLIAIAVARWRIEEDHPQQAGHLAVAVAVQRKQGPARTWSPD